MGFVLGWNFKKSDLAFPFGPLGKLLMLFLKYDRSKVMSYWMNGDIKPAYLQKMSNILFALGLFLIAAFLLWIIGFNTLITGLSFLPLPQLQLEVTFSYLEIHGVICSKPAQVGMNNLFVIIPRSEPFLSFWNQIIPSVWFTNESFLR